MSTFDAAVVVVVAAVIVVQVVNIDVSNVLSLSGIINAEQYFQLDLKKKTSRIDFCHIHSNFSGPSYGFSKSSVAVFLDCLLPRQLESGVC